METKPGSSFMQLPKSKLAWWSAGLAALFVMLGLTDAFAIMLYTSISTTKIQGSMLSFSFPLMACGLASGITALIALFKKNEHSWLVWFALLPGMLTLLIMAISLSAI